MSLLLSVLFVLLVFTYVLFVHKNDYSLSPYISGIIAGVCSLPLAIFLKVEHYTSPNLLAYSFSYFLFYFLASSAFGLFLYFLLNLRSFDVQTTPCALSGIWTVFFFFAAYDFSRSSEVAIPLIFLLLYSLSILFYDVLVMSFRTLPTILVFLLSYSLAINFTYASTFCFAAWLYKYSPLIYIGLPAIFILLFLSLAILLAHKKKSEKGRINRAKKENVEDIFNVDHTNNYKGFSL